MDKDKVYPSQLSTKSIACRIPFDKWTEINSECIEKGVKINDWLLSKVFPSNKNSVGEIDLKEQFLSRDDFYQYICDWHFDGENVSFNEVLNDAAANRLWEFIVNKNKENFSLYEIISWLDILLCYKDASSQHFASPSDIMAQTIVMLPYTQWSIKEQNDYRKDMKKLCDELEQAIENNNNDTDWNVENLLYDKISGKKIR